MNKENRALIAITMIAIASCGSVLIIALNGNSNTITAAVVLVIIALQERALSFIKSNFLVNSAKPDFPEIIYVLPGNIEMQGSFGGVIPAGEDTIFIDDDIFQVDRCIYDFHTSEVRVILIKL